MTRSASSPKASKKTGYARLCTSNALNNQVEVVLRPWRRLRRDVVRDPSRRTAAGCARALRPPPGVGASVSTNEVAVLDRSVETARKQPLAVFQCRSSHDEWAIFISRWGSPDAPLQGRIGPILKAFCSVLRTDFASCELCRAFLIGTFDLKQAAMPGSYCRVRASS